MKKKIELDTCYVEYEDSQEVRDKVFERVMKYFKENNAYIGEVIHQDDDCIIEAPSVLSDIADDIMCFKYTYESN